MKNVWKAIGLVLVLVALAGGAFYNLNVPVVHQTMDGQVQYVEVLDVWKWKVVREPASWLTDYHGSRDIVTGASDSYRQAKEDVRAGRIPKAN